MRDLAQVNVLKKSAVAASITAVLCFPRLILWSTRVYPIWYLLALLWLGSIVLWAFVFAWHTKYTHRPLFTFKIAPKTFGIATACAAGTSLLLGIVVDPMIRSALPQEYPKNFAQWASMSLFSLAFAQLFLLFAPLAWLARLLNGRLVAIPLTVLFGVFVMVVKNQSSPNPLGAQLFWSVLLVRVRVGFLYFYFLLRGGVLLVWWWGLLIQARHLVQIEFMW